MASGPFVDAVIHTATYHGPDRRLTERRAGADRRVKPRYGYGWWDTVDRRTGDRRRA